MSDDRTRSPGGGSGVGEDPVEAEMEQAPPGGTYRKRDKREHRRRRIRRHGRRAYIRSVHFLPSLATLGNALCGFGAIYVAALDTAAPSPDPLTRWFSENNFAIAAWLIFVAMGFDAIDGRLARFTRHTTDFGGQLDSLADVISFGLAPAFLALQLFKGVYPEIPLALSRLIWAIGALYVCCASLRLARFNVSNKHGEQHHFSFLGLPSPAAGGAVAAFILMQRDLARAGWPEWAEPAAYALSLVCVWMLPLLVLATGLLMVSHFRYPHVVNVYLRGRRPLGRLLLVVTLVLLLVVAHQYVLAAATLGYALTGVLSWGYSRLRRHQPNPAA